MPDKGCSRIPGRQFAKIRQSKVNVGSGNKQALLVAEITHDKARIDARIRRNGPNGGPLVPLGCEVLPRGGNDACTCGFAPLRTGRRFSLHGSSLVSSTAVDNGTARAYGARHCVNKR